MMSTVSYDIAETRLANGLRVVVQSDSMSPCFAVNLWYQVGAADESPGATGFAHLFEHLMFQGSANVASGEHFALLESAGGRTNATTSFDRTNYFETVPRGALNLALWLEADRMSSLAVTQANFDAQREVVKEEKRQSYDNQPYGDLLELLLSQHFTADSPYGHPVIGSMEDLDNAELPDVQQFFDTWYTPSNTVLTLVGAISPDEGFELVAKHFGDIPAGRKRQDNGTLLPHRSPGRLDRSADVPQDLLYLSWVGPRFNDPEIDAFDFLIALMSDGLSSRLHRNLVKERQLADSVSASALTLIRTGSVSTISARLDEGHSMEAVEQAILDELHGLLTSPPNAAEMDRTLAQLERSYLSSLASVEQRADLISSSTTWLDDPLWINSYLARMAQITPQQLQELAERYFCADQRYVLTYRKEN